MSYSIQQLDLFQDKSLRFHLLLAKSFINVTSLNSTNLLKEKSQNGTKSTVDNFPFSFFIKLQGFHNIFGNIFPLNDFQSMAFEFFFSLFPFVGGSEVRVSKETARSKDLINFFNEFAKVGVAVTTFNVDDDIDFSAGKFSELGELFRLTINKHELFVLAVDLLAVVNLDFRQINTDGLLGVQVSGNVVQTTTSARANFNQGLAVQIAPSVHGGSHKVVQLDGKSFVFIFRSEVLDGGTIVTKSGISPVHMFPFSARNQPAKNVIELFPHKSSTIHSGIVES